MKPYMNSNDVIAVFSNAAIIDVEIHHHERKNQFLPEIGSSVEGEVLCSLRVIKADDYTKGQ